MSSTVPAPIKALLAAALLLFVGAALLQYASPAGRSDPIASIRNGGPRGLLLLDLALTRLGRPPLRVDGDAALLQAITDDGDGVDSMLIVVPPPEQTAFSAAEAAALVDVARRGARLLVLCDPDQDRQKRLRPLLKELGVACTTIDDDGAPGLPARLATSAPPGLTLLVRDGGRVTISDEAIGVLPLTTTQDKIGVGGAIVGVGRGDIVVLGSVSSVANDGLAQADNLAVLRFLLGSRYRVVVDERHHVTRGAAAIARAVLQGPGPLTALVCALLLAPLAMLSLSPRRGELVHDDDSPDVPAAEARVRGLAALLASAGAPPSSPDPDRSSGGVPP
jgi:hypothetical protein